jgi:hypothetical protein
MKDQFDDKTVYCRTLGHYVPFKYCRTVSDQLPCRKVRDCWHEELNIDRFINEEYNESEHERIFAPPQEKLSTIIDLIKKAQENR